VLDDALLAAFLSPWIAAHQRAQAWQRDALCREPRYAGVNFFPRRGESCEEARAVCARCIVRAECAGYAASLDVTTLLGVWGGTSQRDRLARRRTAA
jgi:WhiB family redox-sensing transcriptional regulator